MNNTGRNTFFALAAWAAAFLAFGGCGRIEFASGVPGKIKAVSLPDPKAPSQVLGIGEAMAAGQEILLYRPARKGMALPDDERNYFFIAKIMESYAPRVKVIELGNSVSFTRGDYYSEISDKFPANGYGVIKKEDGRYKLYTSDFGYSENYDDFVAPVKSALEQVLGPGSFDKKGLIAAESKFEAYNKAVREGGNLILYSFAGACSGFPQAEQEALLDGLRTRFSGEAGLIKVDYKAYTDPSSELYSKCRNIVCVYNGRNKKISPALFAGGDTYANVRKFLDEN